MYELQVEGMTCGGCVASVTRAIRSVDNQAQVAVDLGQKTVRVDTARDLDAIRSAVSDAGYPVTASTAV